MATTLMLVGCAPHDQGGNNEAWQAGQGTLDVCVASSDGWSVRRQVVEDVSFGIASKGERSVKYHLTENKGDIEIEGPTGKGGMLRRAKWPDGEDSLGVLLTIDGANIYVFALTEVDQPESLALATQFLESVKACREFPKYGVRL